MRDDGEGVGDIVMRLTTEIHDLSDQHLGPALRELDFAELDEVGDRHETRAFVARHLHSLRLNTVVHQLINNCFLVPDVFDE